MPVRRWAVLLGLTLCFQASAQKPDSLDERYLRYTHPPITGAWPDLLDLSAPAASPRASLGYVDVTQPPFGADPTGARDALAAVQSAVNYARDHQMACFFPVGTYLLSDTLDCAQGLCRRTNGRVYGGNRVPCLLVGSTAGGGRARLVLKARAPGFDDPTRPKVFVRVWARGYLNPTTADRVGDGLDCETEQPNICMNQMLVNLVLALGEGNPGAIVLRHQGAEGSAIEDCTIDATGGHTGLQGGIGSGGGSTKVTVIGGRIGLDFTGYLGGTQPTPTITGFTLRGQTETAIRSTSRQTLVATGLHLVADQLSGPAIQVPSGAGFHSGQLTLCDSVIDFRGAALAQARRVGIESARGVVLERVYLHGATLAVVDPEQGRSLAGQPGGWLAVRRYARPSAEATNQARTFRYPVYLDGQSVPEIADTTSGEAPPADLRDRHLWPSDFPTCETPGIANVKAPPYGALGDGLADDTAALQRAVDEHDAVLLPRGVYRLTHTLDLRPNTKLLGVGQHLSLLRPTAVGDFADASRPAPLVRTADTADATTVLAFLGLGAPSDVPGAQALVWRCGGRSFLRAVEVTGLATHGNGPRPKSQPAPAPRSAPPVLITGHGGGNWYNYRESRLVIDGASEPLRFYQVSPQQVTNEVSRAADVTFFGTKYEGNDPMFVVRDCGTVRFMGHGGNGKGLPGASLFVIERTPNVLFANGVDGPTRIDSRSLSSPRGSTDPALWPLLIDGELQLPALERPVLYVRGRP